VDEKQERSEFYPQAEQPEAGWGDLPAPWGEGSGASTIPSIVAYKDEEAPLEPEMTKVVKVKKKKKSQPKASAP
jgi:hypothetical protein